MSDLISRSALIEDIRKRSYINKALCEIFETIIDEQPTAYNPEKVVEELEEMKNIGSATKTEILITKACINRAINIVRGGVE